MVQVAIANVLHGWHHADPAEAALEIMESVGDLSGLEVFGQEVIIGPYIRPSQTKSGLHVPGSATAEDRYQGKVGLILKVGPEAFPDKLIARWNGRKPSVGDWVYFDVKSSFEAHVQGVGSKKSPTRDWSGWPVRLVLADDIRGRVARPEWVV